jgi:enamine deaminase RidA (YjgF/YER057c/UK114 family)
VATVIEERLAELGIRLPPAPQPVASYIPVKVVGDLAWVAGQVPMQDGAVTVAGARSRRLPRSARRSGAWIASRAS